MGDAAAPLPVHDVAVVGGGVVGAAVALGLARQGRDVVLVEPSEPAPQRGRLGMDLRTLAVSPASKALLEALGVWRDLPVSPYRRMEVWEERGTRAMIFDAAEVSRDELGWIVEASPLVVALWEILRRQACASLRQARVLGVSHIADRMILVLDGGVAMPAPISRSGDRSERDSRSAHRETIAARLVIAADGAASAVRQHLGVSVRTLDTGHVALATIVRTSRPHEATAYQRFLLDGPLALLPGIDPRLCSVVWSQSPEQAQRRSTLDEARFRRELERAVQSRLGEVEAVDERVTFPLRQQLAATFNPVDRALLIGDAARVLHPLAGLGANLGIEDVREVLAVTTEAGAAGDPGAAGLWRRFDRQRRTRAELMLGAMNVLQAVYARGDPWSQWMRNLGVAWLDRAAPIKRQIMMEAMGLGPVSRGTAAG